MSYFSTIAYHLNLTRTAYGKKQKTKNKTKKMEIFLKLRRDDPEEPFTANG